MNIDKVVRELGWRPKEDLHSGLRKTVQWYLNNPEWAKLVAKRPEYRSWLQKNYRARGGRE
jgi:dTDP-glucose 4,6-dehydratase